ncbi:SMAD/FHA domain-containing protein [Dichotomocladium elegans]|nr:SMAD/FHA domain-containing protein [Dichotomocladium elegans]
MPSSPPRRRRDYSDSPPPRRRYHDSDDASPRRSRRRSSPDRHRDDSRSPPRRQQRRRDSRSASPSQRQQQRDRGRDGGRRDHRNKQSYEWGRQEDREAARRRETEEQPVEKKGPNFGLSGKLASETNTVKGVELKYNEPPEAAKPSHKWRLYVFKGPEQIDLLHIHRQSAYLIGRDRVVADIPVDHPSCSKQHAVLQFRRVTESDPETGKSQEVVKPFIIDLESTNGTFLNGEKIPTTRYVELKIKDILMFGQSTREYVLLHSTM